MCVRLCVRETRPHGPTTTQRLLYTLRHTITYTYTLQELLLASDPGTVDELQSLLGGIGDLDRMLGGVATVDAKEDLASARRMIGTTILLKTFLRRLPLLAEALEKLMPAAAAAAAASGAGMEEEGEAGDGGGNNTDALLQALISAFSPPCFAELSALLDETIAESTHHERSARTRRLQVRTTFGCGEEHGWMGGWIPLLCMCESHVVSTPKSQECFAVSSGIDGLLDVARKVHRLCQVIRHTVPLFVTARHIISLTHSFVLSLSSHTTADVPPVC